MTRKDFEVVAQIIAQLPVPSEEQKNRVNYLLTATNPRFNSQKFWDYAEKMKK